jgi:hypothetical protein
MHPTAVCKIYALSIEVHRGNTVIPPHELILVDNAGGRGEVRRVDYMSP